MLRLALLPFAFAIVAAPTLNSQSSEIASEVPPGLTAEDWSSIQGARDANRHAAQRVEAGFRANNHGLGWQIEFDELGFTSLPDAGEWTWGLELVSYGFDGWETIVDHPVSTAADVNRVSYDWDETLTEWYINDARGLEHGFTVNCRPDQGERPGDAGPLIIGLAVRGGLTPVVAGDARGVRFTGEGGETVVLYSGLTVFDADGRTIPAQLEWDGEMLYFVVHEKDAQYPLTIDPVAQTTYIKASNPDAQDSFGRSVSISGNTIVVGAAGEASSATGINGIQNDNTSGSSGAAYVFVRSGSTWVQQAYLKASNAEAQDFFGNAVAIHQETIVIGAATEASAASGVNGDQTDNSAPGAGAAYVFVRTGSTWTQQAYLKASNPESSDLFGGSVDVTTDTIVVGAIQEDSNATGVNGDESNNLRTSSGAVYAFHRDDAGTPLNLSDDSWTQGAYLKTFNNPNGGRFGNSVAISGNTVIVGAPKEGSSATGINGDGTLGTATRSGAAFVFLRDGSTWTTDAYLKASNANGAFAAVGGDEFGIDVSISGDVIVVGAWFEDSPATGVNGSQLNGALDAGAAYVFERVGSTWSQTTYLKSSNTDIDDFFGADVAVSGDTILVGAQRESSSATGVNGDQSINNPAFGASGAVYMFTRNGASWRHASYLKAPNTVQVANFGTGLAASGDTVVIGAYGDRTSSSGVNGELTGGGALFSGAVHVFEIPPGFTRDVSSISLSAGGQQQLSIDEGPSAANWFYWIFGSATGTNPGLDLGTGLTLPLNFDGYFMLTLNKPGLGAFGNFIGQLDSAGTGSASLTVPAGVDPSLAGITLHHAFLGAAVFGQANYASNATSVLLTL